MIKYVFLLLIMLSLPVFADTYGSGNYSSGNYIGESQTPAPSQQAPSSTSPGSSITIPPKNTTPAANNSKPPTSEETQDTTPPVDDTPNTWIPSPTENNKQTTPAKTEDGSDIEKIVAQIVAMYAELPETLDQIPVINSLPEIFRRDNYALFQVCAFVIILYMFYYAGVKMKDGPKRR